MIESIHNPLVQQLRKLHRRAVRDEQEKFLVEGPEVVAEAFNANAPISMLLIEPGVRPGFAEIARSKSVDVLEVSDVVMRALTTTKNPQGVVAVCGFIDADPSELAGRPPNFSLVLSEVQDPGNAGTILRLSRAAGADAVFFSQNSVDIYNSKLVRATAGALFALPVARESPVVWTLDYLGARKVLRIAADAGGSHHYGDVDMTGPVVIVLGNEARGMTPAVLEACDVRVAIPMPGGAGGAESLNVATAAAVIAFEVARQRRDN